MTRSHLYRLVQAALFTALVAVATMVIQVPMPRTGGFINVGDTMIFVAALLLGPRVGLIAGGLGSALADIILGYAHWAPWTLVIKALEGLIAGWLGHTTYRSARPVRPLMLAAMVAAALWMVAGYYVASGIMYGFAAALADIPSNLIQGGASVVMAFALLGALRAFRQ
ncbi:MAG: ECF transporter S component [Bacillota bacterium]